MNEWSAVIQSEFRSLLHTKAWWLFAAERPKRVVPHAGSRAPMKPFRGRFISNHRPGGPIDCSPVCRRSAVAEVPSRLAGGRGRGTVPLGHPSPACGAIEFGERLFGETYNGKVSLQEELVNSLSAGHRIELSVYFDVRVFFRPANGALTPLLRTPPSLRKKRGAQTGLQSIGSPGLIRLFSPA
jgi:hypothetical protein